MEATKEDCEYQVARFDFSVYYLTYSKFDRIRLDFALLLALRLPQRLLRLSHGELGT